MRKIKGFTLAEVLITLAIVGVVASLTLPALMTNTQKATVGTSLAKMFNTLENTNRLLLTENSARSLSTICEDGYVDCISKYVPGSKQAVADTNYLAYDLSTTAFTPVEGYMTKDGMAIYVTANPADEPIENVPAKYYGKYYTVYVDTNGIKKKPNSVGRDTFLFYVDLSGNVIPYGGNSYKEYTAGESVLWETSCLKTGPTDGASCTGSIADNNWSVVY